MFHIQDEIKTLIFYTIEIRNVNPIKPLYRNKVAFTVYISVYIVDHQQL